MVLKIQINLGHKLDKSKKTKGIKKVIHMNLTS